MKISKFDTSRLRNDEHFQFHTAFRNLVNKHGPQALKVETQFGEYLKLYEREDDGIKKINKSALTAEIQEADKARDVIWSSLVKVNSAALNHFDPETAKAAKRLKIVLDTYGNVAAKPLNEQTSAVYNILRELHSKYAEDMKAVGIDSWAKELGVRNENFNGLMEDRFDEASLKTDIKVKEARARLDEAYKDITARINAQALLEGEEAYAQFIRGLNVVIEKYAETLSRRVGKKK